MNLKKILLSLSMINKIREFIPDFDPVIHGFEVLYNNELPLSNNKLIELFIPKFLVLGENEDGCEIIDINQIKEIPPIDVKKIADKYQVINGRHRVVHAILNGFTQIEVKVV